MESSHNILEQGGGCTYTHSRYFQYNVADLDADGKSDIVNGTDFLKGIVTGAVLGGAMGGISWGVSKTVQYYNSKKPLLINSNELEEMGYDVSNNSSENYYTSDSQIQSDFSKTTGDYQASVDNINTEFKLVTSDVAKHYDYQITHDYRIISNDPRESGYILGFNVSKRKSLMEFLIKGYVHGYHRYLGYSSMENFRANTESSAYHYSINILKKNGIYLASYANSFYISEGVFLVDIVGLMLLKILYILKNKKIKK